MTQRFTSRHGLRAAGNCEYERVVSQGALMGETIGAYRESQ